ASRDALHAGAKSPRGALAMHQQGTRLAIDDVPLELSGVVGDVVHHVHAEFLGGTPKYTAKNLTNAVQNHLAVGEGHVDAAFHGGKVIASFRRIEWGTGQFTIEDLNAVLALHHPQEDLQVIGRDLMSEATAAAVKHHHDLIRHGDAK